MNKVDEKAVELSDQLRAELGVIELRSMEYTLADAIREGSSVTTQAYAWGDGENACALTAGVIAARARGFIR
jgi:hypothetical protein